MKKRLIWLVVSGLMALSLVLASCAPKVTETPKVTEEKKVVAEEKVVTEEKVVVAAKEEPRYGGWLNTVMAADPSRGFTRTVNYGRGHLSYNFVASETLLQTDPLKGPGGSGEWSMLYDIHPPVAMMAGLLAESWEIIEPDTLIMHIRKGVRWQAKPPANGMEFTAEDVVYSFVLGWAMPGSTWPAAYPNISDLKNPENSIYIRPDDPWTVVFKSKPGELSLLWERVAGIDFIVPRALGDPKGTGPDTWSWKTVVGTGPFLLTDYVTGSSLTWTRNPNYWQKDPFHPQNQLPYVDGVKAFIIADESTRLAALRTGKIDILTDMEAEDAENIMKTNPELRWKEVWGDDTQLFMRNDVKPWDNVNVRRAMMMAINHDEIVKDYYGGKAEKFYWPAFPIPEHSLMYRPLTEMPQSVQVLYGYYPDKAKQLLAEAGYRDGFKTSVVVSAAEEKQIDLLSIIKAYWAKVGVTLEIQVKEATVYATMGRAFSYEQGYVAATAAPWDAVKFVVARVGSASNYAQINDPVVEKTLKDVGVAYWNWTEHSRIIREAMPEIQNRALIQFLPIWVAYNFWQPWIRDYHGEITASYKRTELSAANWVWIDQELKKSMGR